MRHQLCGIACGFALFLCVGSLSAAVPVKELDWNEPVGRFAEFIAELSAARYEEAWQVYRVMLPEPPKTPQTPFEPDPFENFKQAVGRFPANIESFQHVATRQYSDRSRRMYFIADTDFGPYVVEMMIFRAKDQWFFAHFGYHSIAAGDMNWHKQNEDVLPVTKLSQPVDVPLPKREPVAETAGK
jgi:hypothetical protein